MLKNLLIPLDGSLLAECVLPHTVAFAKAFNAQITLMNVVEQPSNSVGQRKADPLDWYLQKTEATTYLMVVKARLEKLGVAVNTLLVEGHAAEQIVDSARPDEVDLLILSSHGQSENNGWSVSNIVQQIIQRTRTSMLLVPAQQPTALSNDFVYHRLLVPLDGSRRAGAVLPLATALVQSHNSALTLVHVVSKPEMARHMPLTPEDVSLINQFVERNQDEGNKYLEQVRGHLSATVQTQLLVSDNIAATLQDFSEQEQIDLLILSAHGYSGEARWPYGSITNRFITDGTVPLLIVQDLPNEGIDAGRDDVAIRQMVR